MIVGLLLSLFVALFASLGFCLDIDINGAGVGFLRTVIWYASVFLPVKELAPIVGLIVLIRNVNIVLAIWHRVLSLVPFK